MQIQIIKIQITYIAEIKKTKKTPKRIHVRKTQFSHILGYYEKTH